MGRPSEREFYRTTPLQTNMFIDGNNQVMGGGNKKGSSKEERAIQGAITKAPRKVVSASGG